jgi:hypothetical protein
MGLIIHLLGLFLQMNLVLLLLTQIIAGILFVFVISNIFRIGAYLDAKKLVLDYLNLKVIKNRNR